MLFFFVRHGDPIYNPDSLTPLGRRQAEAVGKRLAKYGLDQIYASTSTRAIQTAEPASEMTKLPITQLDWCNEGHAWTDFAVKNAEGNTTWCFWVKEVRDVFLDPATMALGNQWYTDPRLSQYTFDRGYERIHRETTDFFASLGYERIEGTGTFKAVKHNNDRVALFAHQGFGIAFLSDLLNIPYPLFAMHMDICHTGLSVIEFSPWGDVVVPKMITHSSDAHLYAEGLATAYNNSRHLRF